MKSARLPFLGDLERAVMEHLWARGASDAKQVHRELGRRRGITLNTIQSTLKRLFEKGLLGRDKVSHAHVYAPRLTRDEYQQNTLRQIIDELMGGEAEALAKAFVAVTDQVSVEELERLERLIAERLEARRGPESA